LNPQNVVAGGNALPLRNLKRRVSNIRLFVLCGTQELIFRASIIEVKKCRVQMRTSYEVIPRRKRAPQRLFWKPWMQRGAQSDSNSLLYGKFSSGELQDEGFRFLSISAYFSKECMND